MFIRAKVDQVIPQLDQNGQQRCGVSKKDGSKFRIYQVIIVKEEERDGRKFEESFACDCFQTFSDPSEPAPYSKLVKDGNVYDCTVSFRAELYQGRFYQRINLHSITQSLV